MLSQPATLVHGLSRWCSCVSVPCVQPDAGGLDVILPAYTVELHTMIRSADF